MPCAIYCAILYGLGFVDNCLCLCVCDFIVWYCMWVCVVLVCVFLLKVNVRFVCESLCGAVWCVFVRCVVPVCGMFKRICVF